MIYTFLQICFSCRLFSRGVSLGRCKRIVKGAISRDRTLHTYRLPSASDGVVRLIQERMSFIQSRVEFDQSCSLALTVQLQGTSSNKPASFRPNILRSSTRLNIQFSHVCFKSHCARQISILQLTFYTAIVCIT